LAYLQDAEFRKSLAKNDVFERIQQQQFLHWQYHKRDV
jgi:hypothetical protein